MNQEVKKTTISIVAPLYNEEKNIQKLIHSLKENLERIDSNYEIILVDDGSADDTWKVIEAENQKNSKIKGLKLNRNFGQHPAIAAGLNHASGKYIIMMDGDLQDGPEHITELYSKIQQGYQIVYAVKSTSKKMSFKNLWSNIFNFVMHLITGKKISIDNSIFCIITNPVLEEVKKYQNDYSYIPGVIAYTGFKKGYVKFNRSQRDQGKSKYNFKKQINLATNAIFAFADDLTKKLLTITTTFFIINISIIFYALVFASSKFAILLLVILLTILGLAQITGLYLLTEYSRRKYLDGKNRPAYTIEKKLNL